MKEKNRVYFDKPKLMILSPFSTFDGDGLILAYAESYIDYGTYINYRIEKIEKCGKSVKIKKCKNFNKVYNNKYPQGRLPFLSKKLHKRIIEINSLPDEDIRLYYELNGLDKEALYEY